MENKSLYSTKTIQDFISLIERIDLSTYPIDEITLGIKNITPMPKLIIQIRKGERVFRGRYIDNELFVHPKDFSYNPFQKSIGRANLANTSCFYGCLETNLMDPNIPVVYELGLKERMSTLPKNTFSNSTIGISCWEFTEDVFIELSGFNCIDYFENGSDFERLCKKYYNELKEYYRDEDYSIVMKYFKMIGTEFTKKKVDHDFEYLISAVYSKDTMNEQEIAGIAYPSKQVNGKATNIAIKPSIVDSKLKFINVSYVEIHSYNESTIMFKTKETLSNTENPDGPILFKTFKGYSMNYIKEQLMRKNNDFLKLKNVTEDNKKILGDFKTQFNNDGSITLIV